MPKETDIKALQKKKAQEYFDSNDDSDESSDDNFMEYEDPDKIIRLLAAFREAAVGSLKISQFFSNNQQLAANNDESSRDFQDQNDQGGETSGEESGEELDEKKKFIIRLSQKKLEAAKMVANIVNGRPWLARSIRVWANICLKKELIQPDLREKSLSKSLLYDELVSLKWNNPDCKIRTFSDLNNGENELVWVTHDETTFYVYNGLHSVWGPKREQPLCKKGLGSAIHISNFLMETIGLLKDDQEKARVLGSNRDGYWNSVKLLKQVQRAIRIFERTHPG
ncbi:29089_t:CDS:2, partial [Gigaspora margarita]